MNMNSPGYYKTELTNKNGKKITKSILIDDSVQSPDPSKPAFIALPADAKAYHGFPLIKETTIDGFIFGSVTDFLENDSDHGCSIGDAFVEAPDGKRAGIFWEVSSELKFSRMMEPDNNRWGVYYFTVLKPVKSVKDLKDNFVQMLPALKALYAEAHKL
jgi:hypothetical protein